MREDGRLSTGLLKKLEGKVGESWRELVNWIVELKT